MNVVNIRKTMTLFSLLFLLFAVNIGNSIAGEISAADQKIIDAGVKKAKELGLNPLPICEGEKGNLFIPAGFVFSISGGGFSVKNGDMVIFAGKTSFKVEGITLTRGEYVIIENNKAKKGASKLVTD